MRLVWLLACACNARLGELMSDAERLGREARGMDQAAKLRIAEEVRMWNKRLGKTRPLAATATLVTGYLRTGRFEAVASNVRESVFAALGSRTDVFWIVADAPRLVEGKISETLTRWGPNVARAVVELADMLLYERIEANCSASVDTSVRFELRACLPARSQFLAMARAWTLIVDSERQRDRYYSWIVRIRPDMIHKKPLPPDTDWTRAPRAAYLDGWRWFRNCSAASPCTCFCAGDRFGVVARTLASAVFGIAARLLQRRGCSPTDRCPRQFLEPDQHFCYANTRHLYPECILGSALLDAGLDPYKDVKRLPAGDILSCGPSRLPAPTNTNDSDSNIANHRSYYRSPDNEPCLAAYWRHESHRLELGQSIDDRPIPPVKTKIIPFW